MTLTMDIAQLKKELTRDEGLRLKPYLCTAGKTTIGIGRNLTDVGITNEEADYLLDHDIARTVRELDKSIPWWRGLDDVRQRVIVNMAFNLGINSLMGFKNTLAAIKDGRYEAAAAGMMASKWAEQVGPRAVRLADLMKTGA